MQNILSKNLFFVKEHIEMFKAANNYDILDPETKEILIECREENLGGFTKLLRFTKYKRFTPFNIKLKTPENDQVSRISRGVTFLRSKVSIFDEADNYIGYFKSKIFTIGGGFDIYDANDTFILSLKGKWTSWQFKLLSPENVEYAEISKKWSGLGKELFTSADNYIIKIADNVEADLTLRKLILSSALCIDMVLKE